MRSLRATLFVRSLLLQAGFSDERRQGLGFAWAIDPALVAAYGTNAAGLAAARARHLASFNTQPCAAGLVLGTTAALEARAAAGDSAAAGRAAALKGVLGATLAGAADAFFWGALRPAAGALAALTALAAARLGAPRPFLLGAAIGLSLFNAPALAARWLGLSRGLSEADAAALAVSKIPAAAWTRAVRLLALGLILAAAALYLPETRAPLSLGAFAAGAWLARPAGGPLRLVGAAGLLGAAVAAATRWTP